MKIFPVRQAIFFLVFAITTGCSKEYEFSTPKVHPNDADVKPVAVLATPATPSPVPSPVLLSVSSPAPIALNEKTLLMDVVGEPEPHKYSVHFKWPKTEGKVKVLMHERDLIADALDGQLIIPIRDNENFTLFFDYINKESLITFQKTYNIVTQEDLVIDREKLVGNEEDSLRPMITAERIFLEEKGTLSVCAEEVTIKTNFFFARGGKIENWPEQVQKFTFEELEEKSPNGGKITIFAKNAKGNLVVVMNGLKGLTGNGGASIPKLPRASSGKDGNPKATADNYKDACGRMGAYGVDGRNGLPGQKGGKGGNTGDLTITVEKDLGFIVSPIFKPGEGGEGGEGGPPQEGQQGGAPGKSYGGWCKDEPGKDGSRGKAGPKGPPGDKGDLGKFTLEIAKNNAGEKR